MVDATKAELLFGPIPEGLDPDDQADRAALLAAGLHGGETEVRLALREILATQVENEDPPEVWACARRLLTGGLDRVQVLEQLTLALAHASQTLVEHGESFELSGYVALLGLLPVPPVEAIEEAIVEVVRSRQGLAPDELAGAVLAALDRPPTDALTARMVEFVLDLVTDEEGPVVLLGGARLVHPRALLDGAVLTHRLTDVEHDHGVLTVSFDLAAFDRVDDPHLADGTELEVFSVQEGHVGWRGPDGWLAGLARDAVVAVAVDAHSVVSVEAIDGPSPDGPLEAGLVADIRRYYDLEHEATGLPVSGEAIILDLLLDQPAVLGRPHPPLVELCQAAGLERRGHAVAHDEAVWVYEARARRVMLALQVFDDVEKASAAAWVFDAADDPDTSVDDLREALRALRDAEVAQVIAGELATEEQDWGAADLSRRLLGAAKGQAELAVAHWVAGVVAEHLDDLGVAEAELTRAVDADPDWPPAVDRLAWYAADRGDAQRAARLWRRIGAVDNPDLEMVGRFVGSAGPRVGRNDPCWCGSGRKYKACHLDQPDVAPLALRARWLWRKGVAYLDRCGASRDDLADLVMARAADPDDETSLERAATDPLVADVALIEGGWWDRFVTARGPLLPADEAALARRWAGRPRTVYEVLTVRPGGVVVRDTRDGTTLRVADPAFAAVVSAGERWCGRAVPADLDDGPAADDPDGDGDQPDRLFVGALLAVAPDDADELLGLCEAGDGEAICSFAAELDRANAGADDVIDAGTDDGVVAEG